MIWFLTKRRPISPQNLLHQDLLEVKASMANFKIYTYLDPIPVHTVNTSVYFSQKLTNSISYIDLGYRISSDLREFFFVSAHLYFNSALQWYCLFHQFHSVG